MPWLIIPYRLFIIHFSCHSFQRLLRPPAAGFRHCSTGALTDVGTSGWYLSSSPCVAGEGRVGAFALYAVSVHPLTVTNRAYGDSVRCVQHLPTAFYLFAGPYLVVPAGCRPKPRSWRCGKVVRSPGSCLSEKQKNRGFEANNEKIIVPLFVVPLYPALLRPDGAGSRGIGGRKRRV